MDSKWVNFTDGADSVNPVEYIDISHTQDFRYLALNNNHQKFNDFQVFSQRFSTVQTKETLSCMTNFKIDQDDETSFSKFVRNQKSKRQMFCLFYSKAKGYQIYNFYQGDADAMRKIIPIEGMHHYALPDVMLFPNLHKEKETDLSKKILCVVSIQKSSQEMFVNCY